MLLPVATLLSEKDELTSKNADLTTTVEKLTKRLNGYNDEVSSAVCALALQLVPTQRGVQMAYCVGANDRIARLLVAPRYRAPAALCGVWC